MKFSRGDVLTRCDVGHNELCEWWHETSSWVISPKAVAEAAAKLGLRRLKPV